MMSPRRYLALFMVLMMTAVSVIIFNGPDDVNALPDGYPISLSGGYSEEILGTTTYIDYLQPGDTENYLIRLENDEAFEARYRIIISGIPDGWLVFLDNGNQNMPVDLGAYETESTYLYIKNPKEGTADLLINVTDEGSNEFWTITLRIICQVGPLLVSVDNSNFIVGRDVPAVFEMDVENIGDVVLNVTLDMSSIVASEERISDTWTVKFSERSFLIPPFATKTITAKVYAPQFEPIGSQKVSTLEAKVGGITRPFSSRSLTFRVQTIFDLRTSVSPIGYQKVNPGTSVEFDLLLENLASATDYVKLSEFSTPSGWSISFNDSVDPTLYSVSIDPESSRKFHPVVLISPHAIAGKHEVVMRATGESNLTEFKLLVEVARKDAVEGISTPPAGQGNTYRMTLGPNLVTFELRNRGNFFDTVTLEIENRPAWAPFKFHSVRIGDGSEEIDVSGTQPLNISSADSTTFTFTEDNLETIKIILKPSQIVRITLAGDVSLDSAPERGVVGIKYKYGVFGKQSFLQLSLKLVIVDIEILDINLDGIPDLLLYPKPDYDFNDKIYFTFKIKNNYPYSTREGDVEWKIELAGIVLLKGDVGIILPGDVKEFNFSWKADQSTNKHYFAHLKLSGSVYEIEEQAPRAKSEDEISIESGVVSRGWGMMVFFLVIMLVLIIGFIALFMINQKVKEDREKAAQAKYEKIYGRNRPPGLGRGRTNDLPGSAAKGKALPKMDRPELPSPKEEDLPQKKEKKMKKPTNGEKEDKGSIEKIDTTENGRKKAPSLKDLEVGSDE
jgi:uncharacterized membrane protein